MNCPFCNVDAEKNRCVRETELSIVLLSNPRLLKGHTLVIPKRHIEKPWELTPAELQDIFTNIWWVEEKLLKIAEGCDIRQNYRPFIQQGRVKVNHVHFHVLPRTNEDELYQKSMRFEEFHDLIDQERNQIVKLFET